MDGKVIVGVIGSRGHDVLLQKKNRPDWTRTDFGEKEQLGPNISLAGIKSNE